jgi:hypothetical protein
VRQLVHTVEQIDQRRKLPVDVDATRHRRRHHRCQTTLLELAHTPLGWLDVPVGQLHIVEDQDLDQAQGARTEVGVVLLNERRHDLLPVALVQEPTDV